MGLTRQKKELKKVRSKLLASFLTKFTIDNWCSELTREVTSNKVLLEVFKDNLMMNKSNEIRYLNKMAKYFFVKTTECDGKIYYQVIRKPKVD